MTGVPPENYRLKNWFPGTLKWEYPWPPKRGTQGTGTNGGSLINRIFANLGIKIDLSSKSPFEGKRSHPPSVVHTQSRLRLEAP